MLRLASITVVLGLAILWAVLAGAESGWFGIPSFSNEIVAFFALCNVSLYWVIDRSLDEAPGGFVRVYLGATVLRILFFGGFIFAVIYLDPSGASKNALFFLVCYFIFTTVEIGALWLKIKG